MERYTKPSGIPKTILLIICFLLLSPGFLLADNEDDEAQKAARKAALNEFFGKQLCADCHGPTPVYNISSAREGYDKSGHKNNGNAFYANGDECIKCHTHEGFLKYGPNDKIDSKAFIKMPTQPRCFTCHDPHERGDLSLRKTEAVLLAAGESFDKGKGNLCAYCHQSRRKVTEIVEALPADKLSGHWGAHHGPQADMLIGTNAYEFPGKTYYSSVHATLTKNSCNDCHMTLPAGRFRFNAGIGGHSFAIGGEVHHDEELNTAGCLGSCHAKMKTVKMVNPDTPTDDFWWHQHDTIFATEAKADFDNDMKVEPLQAEIEGLLNLFVNKKGTGYFQRGELPMYKADGSWNGTKSKKERSINEVAALWNYKFVLEDRSRGIHNAPYAIQILYDSIAALDPGFDTSKRNIYRPPEEYKPPEPKTTEKK